MRYMDPLPNWSTHDRCLWTLSLDRQDYIENQMKVYLDYKPLDVNNDKRWKAKVMQKEEEPQKEDTQRSLNKAVAILNKLSWTTLDKMTIQFLEALTPSGLSSVVLKESMTLVVEKAMMEPHFAELYASFTTKLANVNKDFRTTLLVLCQEQFEKTNKEEEEAAAAKEQQQVLKNKSIGLMKFIGELYKNQLIKGRVMVGCLQRLLQPDDEEKVECFAQLMTTIGARLHLAVAQVAETSPDAAAAVTELQFLWQQKYSMAGRSTNHNNGPVAPSVRIKFLLQDLIELKENKWITKRRHKEEKAKTIQQIHQEVAQEEQDARRGGGFGGPHGNQVPRSHSFNSGTQVPPRSRSFNSRSSPQPRLSEKAPLRTNV